MSKTRRDTLELLCDLTDAELIERARTGAHAQEELVKLEGIKKSWMNAHKEQVNAQAGLVSRMANCVFTGREKRLVNCITYFHTPSVGMKTIVRTDTGEVHEEVAMEQRELQENLFEKPEEAEALPAGSDVLPPQIPELKNISQACDGGAHVSCDGCDCGCHECVVDAPKAAPHVSTACYGEECGMCILPGCECTCHGAPDVS